jgi:sugar phosphate isomerase/epimerase
MFDFGISTIIKNDSDVFSAVETVEKSSFKYLEIRCEKGHFNHEDKKEIERLKSILKKKSLSGISLHPPVWVDIANKEEWTRMKSVREVEKVILVAKRLNIPKIVLHPGMGAGDIDKAKESLSELVEFADEWDAKLILENTFPDNFGSGIDELQAISDKFKLPVCVDTSHASARADILARLLDIFQDRIEHFHLSDSMMEGTDDHLIPYEGKINWEPVVGFMQTHKGFAIFEVPYRNNPETTETLKKIVRQWQNEKICP